MNDIRSLFTRNRIKNPTADSVEDRQSGDNPYTQNLISASIQVAMTGKANEAEQCVTYTRELQGSEDIGVPTLYITLNMPKAGVAGATYSFLLVEEKFLSSDKLREVFSCTWTGDGKPCPEYSCGDWESRLLLAAEDSEGALERAAFIANLGRVQSCGLT